MLSLRRGNLRKKERKTRPKTKSSRIGKTKAADVLRVNLLPYRDMGNIKLIFHVVSLHVDT